MISGYESEDVLTNVSRSNQLKQKVCTIFETTTNF